MTWLPSRVAAGRLIAELVATAAGALILRPTARLLQLVDDAHDIDPTPDKETDA